MMDDGKLNKIKALHEYTVKSIRGCSKSSDNIFPVFIQIFLVKQQRLIFKYLSSIIQIYLRLWTS